MPTRRRQTRHGRDTRGVDVHAHRQHIMQTIEWMIGTRAATALRNRAEAHAVIRRERTNAIPSREPEFAVA